MKKLFKRFAPLLLALVMALGSCLTVSAATFPPCNDDDKVFYSKIIQYLNDNDIKIPKYQIFIGQVGQLALFDEPYLVYDSKLQAPGTISIYCYSNGSVTLKHPSDLYMDNLWHLPSSWRTSSNYDVYAASSSGASTGNIYLASDTTGFFPTPPPLVAAVKGAAPEEALKEVILLIPLSILFLAGYLGLRKGLRLLLTLLHRA